jgi:propanediol dehydratase large subunit
MGNAEQKSMLYLEVRCLYLTKACGVQGIQNGSINAIPLVAALPNGFRAIAAENLIASMLNIEVAAGNDTAFTHSDFRRGVKLAMQFMPGTDYITSGYGGIPNLDNVFAGSNEDCDDYDDYYVLQRDMKVDGGIKPIREEEAIAVRNKAAKVCQTVFRFLGLPEITDEEVEAATYAYCYTDMPPRNKAEDMKAATDMMERGITGFDIVKGLYENGFEEIADRVMNMLKQRVIGDYLHTSSVLDENFRVLSAVNDQNDYMGPGTGYRISDERWAELKEKFSALRPQDI